MCKELFLGSHVLDTKLNDESLLQGRWLKIGNFKYDSNI